MNWFKAKPGPPPLPLPNTYWVLPGRLLAGEHPCGADEPATRERLARLTGGGIDYFVDLTEAQEMPDYRPLLERPSEYLRSAIVDTSVPDDVAQMRSLQSDLREALAVGRCVYVHCRAGIGRTGLVVGCYLIETGLDARAALKQLNQIWRQSARSKRWPRVPQTRQQAEYILQWPQWRNCAETEATPDGR